MREMSENYTNEASRISAGSRIKGEIVSPNDIYIDGTFEGRVISEAKVIVGQKAVVNGDIICDNCEFGGRINGNFFVKDTLSLKSSCVVNGDLHVKRLQVELDAKFNGNCRMISEDEFAKLTGRRQEAPSRQDPQPMRPEAAQPVRPQVSQQAVGQKTVDDKEEDAPRINQPAQPQRRSPFSLGGIPARKISDYPEA